MKKWIIYVVSVLVILAIMIQLGWLEIFGIHRVSFSSNEKAETSASDTADVYNYVTEGGVSYRVRTEGDSFFVFQSGEWKKTFWKGVNIGAGEPGLFPGDLSISYTTYYRWFGQISAMNANCIRVYTTLQPQFYEALRDFNEKAKNPLYLFQGVWMDEDDIVTYADVYADNNKIMDSFITDAKNCVDVIHGKATLPERAGFASGSYTADVSKWFGGWILGMEFDPNFIQNTNDSNADKNKHDGTYLYTYGATPFETFLCTAGDELIAYETATYSFQAPVAFTNWVTTDPLTHAEEPYPDEDKVTLSTESIRSRTAFHSNLFASYHVYPYYPDSLNYQKDYLTYRDDTGKVNTYKAYLTDLKLAHSVPIMIAEFGVSTSRGTTHESVMGYNQGGVDETEAGAMLADMFQSMYDCNYAGGIVFTWQDEWFKRTWNNVSFDVADNRPFWSNAQTSEQHFGILSFDPGTNATCLIDGKTGDWAGVEPIYSGTDGSLSVKSDEEYVYFLVKAAKGYQFATDTLVIPIDTISEQGNTRMNDGNATFDRAADFVIRIHGKDDTRILCDAYYDAFYYLYGEQYGMIQKNAANRKKNTGVFNPMMMCYGYEMTIPTTKQVVPFASYETGKLTYGISDPEQKEYSSLADFCAGDGVVEIRIPWQLLNVMDPSTKKNMSDFYVTQSITPAAFTSFRMGLGKLSTTGGETKIKLGGTFTYTAWKTPTYHERLKPTYYVLQKFLKELN